MSNTSFMFVCLIVIIVNLNIYLLLILKKLYVQIYYNLKIHLICYIYKGLLFFSM